MKLMVRLNSTVNDLAKSQKAFLDSITNGRNGRHRNR
jgi:hypothetical protein